MATPSRDPNSTSGLAQALQDVTSRTQLLVREEIELAKTEVAVKVKKLGKGAAVGAVASVFAVTALLFLLHALAFFLWQLVADDLEDIFLGYLMVTGLLLFLGLVAGLLALRWIKKGTPPTPELAIKEAHRIKDTVQHPPGPRAEIGEAR